MTHRTAIFVLALVLCAPAMAQSQQGMKALQDREEQAWSEQDPPFGRGRNLSIGEESPQAGQQAQLESRDVQTGQQDMQAGQEAAQAGRAEIVGGGRAMSFASLDKDSDNILSRNEFEALESPAVGFGQLDLDGDGVLSENEYGILDKRAQGIGRLAFSDADIDQDQNVSKMELQVLTGQKVQISEHDANKDGVLSQSEYDQSRSQIAQALSSQEQGMAAGREAGEPEGMAAGREIEESEGVRAVEKRAFETSEEPESRAEAGARVEPAEEDSVSRQPGADVQERSGAAGQ